MPLSNSNLNLDYTSLRNSKYLIVYLIHKNNAAQSDVRYQLEVRPLNDLNKCLFIKLKAQFYKWISGTPDVTEKDELLYASFQGLYLDKMDIKAEAVGNEAKSHLMAEWAEDAEDWMILLPHKW